jgi:hypothetical protein
MQAIACRDLAVQQLAGLVATRDDQDAEIAGDRAVQPQRPASGTGVRFLR